MIQPFNADPYGFEAAIGQAASGMTRAQNAAQPPAAAMMGDTRLGRMSGGEPVYQETDYRRGPDPSGRPVVEMAPSQQGAPQVQDQDEIMSFLNADMDARAEAVASQFEQQNGIVRNHFQSMLGNLEGEYKIERKYVEQTPMDAGQREEKIRQLNLRYEKQIYKLKQESEGPLSELQSKQSEAMSKLEAKRAEAARRVQTVRDLAKSGKITDEQGALQEQLQAIGISVPLSTLKPAKAVTPLDQLKGIRSELEFVDSVMPNIVAKNKNTVLFEKNGTLRKDARIIEGPQSKPRSMTPAEREAANQLFAQQRDLKATQAKLLKELNVGRLTAAMHEAGTQQGDPFKNGVAKLTQGSKKKVTRELASKLSSMGLTKAEAAEWLVENGYDVDS